MKNEHSAQPTATAPLRSMLGHLVGRRLISFEDPPAPAPKPAEPPPKPAEPPPKPAEKTPEQLAEEKEAADMELKWKGLKLPDGAEAADDKLIERTVAEARKLGLSPEHASGALALINQEATSARERAMKDHSIGGVEWKKQVDAWEADALKDAEIGGTPEKLQASVTKARAVVDKYFPASVKEFLHKSGFGSRPDVIKGFLAIAKAAGEGAFESPAPGSKKDVATKFYGEAEK